MFMLLKDLIEVSSLLGESNEPLPYHMVRNNAEELLYTFAYGDTYWFVDFQKNKIGRQLGIVIAETTFYENPENKLIFSTTNKFTYSGSVFGTVVAIIQDVFAHLDAIVFIGSADRISLYKRLIRKFATVYHTYRFDDNSGSLWVMCKEELQPDVLDVIQNHSANIIRNKT